MLGAKSLTKWFGAIRAVSDVTFTLRAGESSAIDATMMLLVQAWIPLSRSATRDGCFPHPCVSGTAGSRGRSGQCSSGRAGSACSAPRRSC